MNIADPGDQVGPWKLLYLFGKGGSSEVWAAEDSSGSKVALKILWKQAFRRRFLDEIRLYRNLDSRTGILPLIDSHIPSHVDAKAGAQPWLAMEVGTPVIDYLGPDADLALVIDAVKEYASTLVSLAEENIYHRDIKPSNLYWLNGHFVIGDFGIADFPEKSGLTRTGERLGPANFLAPEMIEYSGEVQSGPADVYSLAKTLWAIVAGHKFPPPGELRRDNEAFRLSSYTPDSRAVMLESLIEASTAHDPSRRPTMQSIRDELTWWGQSEVSTKLDLSDYRSDVERIREAKRAIKPETEEQRTGRLRDAANRLVREEIFDSLISTLQSAGLQRVGPAAGAQAKWPHDDEYGGGWTSDYWGIDTLASPWLELHAGIFQREHPVKDETDTKVAVLLAMMTPESQENLVYYFESFNLGSLQLNRLVERIKSDVEAQFSEIISNFLTRCKTSGIPR
jgi:serine/threonine protein kinase